MPLASRRIGTARGTTLDLAHGSVSAHSLAQDVDTLWLGILFCKFIDMHLSLIPPLPFCFSVNPRLSLSITPPSLHVYWY